MGAEWGLLNIWSEKGAQEDGVYMYLHVLTLFGFGM